ncbi:uncharacterized protein LY89DRAFT_726713 [Mollisia scopiformis]|uniref:Uncharacterized protein n=1 Tax=Mollisia scopiformis TaxID=149040 RepID=A0A132B1D5_MOLSC|nr:uncharacterized protein LY89DRAFT_726713 [Mollisia scopiformis]KUJ06188.1 hypothetical protein LY89DRAFT_726713 [Mollisia scopiformis]
MRSRTFRSKSAPIAESEILLLVSKFANLVAAKIETGTTNGKKIAALLDPQLHPRPPKPSRRGRQLPEGVCSGCRKRDAAPGLKSCQACRDRKRREWSRRAKPAQLLLVTRPAVEASPLCLGCNKRDAVPGLTICQTCRDRRRFRDNRALKQGKCSGCKIRDPVPGLKSCQKCRDMKRQQYSRREKQTKLLEATELLDKRPLSKCSSCRIRYAVPKFKLCQLCKNRSNFRARRLVQQGKCSSCKSRYPVLGLKTCQNCRDKRRRPKKQRVEETKRSFNGFGGSTDSVVISNPNDTKHALYEGPQVPKLPVLKPPPRLEVVGKGKPPNFRVANSADEPLVLEQPVEAMNLQNVDSRRCGSCYKHDVRPGRLQCESCIHSMEEVLAERKALGLCADCDDVPVPGSNRCEIHLTSMREHSAKAQKYARARVLQRSLDGKCTYYVREKKASHQQNLLSRLF